ncbi:MAG: hypothetical protein H7Z13_03965 [Ferruginibacter sp.]|nr:hypothetical protein [Ferruginibacter sp.]
MLPFGAEPSDEPIISHGSLLMNNRAEITEASGDFNAGKKVEADHLSTQII